MLMAIMSTSLMDEQISQRRDTQADVGGKILLARQIDDRTEHLMFGEEN